MHRSTVLSQSCPVPSTSSLADLPLFVLLDIEPSRERALLGPGRVHPRLVRLLHAELRHLHLHQRAQV